MKIMLRVLSVLLACASALLYAAPAQAAAPTRPDSLTLGPLIFDAANNAKVRVDAHCASKPGRFAQVDVFVSQPGASVDMNRRFECTGRPQRLTLNLQGVRPGLAVQSVVSWRTDCGMEWLWVDDQDGLQEVAVCENNYWQQAGREHPIGDGLSLLPTMKVDSIRLLRDGSVRVRGTTACRPGEASPSHFDLTITQGEVTSTSYPFSPRCTGRPSAFDVRVRSTGTAFKAGSASVVASGGGDTVHEYDDGGNLISSETYSHVDLSLSIKL